MKDQYLIRHKKTRDSFTTRTASGVANFLWGKRSSEWDVWRRCEITSHDSLEIRAELERVERMLKQRESTVMNWTPEALATVRGLETNCADFIDEACEFVATKTGATEVTTEHVSTVLAWMASVSVDLGFNERGTP